MFEMMLTGFPLKTGNAVWPNELADLPVTTIDWISTDVPTEMYVSGGVTAAVTASRKLWHYNGLTNKWTDLGAVPARTAVNGTNNTAYVAGNIILHNGDVIDVYNTTTKVWSTKTGPTYGTVYHSNANGGVVYKGNAYFFGTSTSPQSTLLKKYVLATNTWSTEATYNPTVSSGAYMRGVVIGDLAYFFSPSATPSTVITYNFLTKAFATIVTPYTVASRSAVVVNGTDIFVAPSSPSGSSGYQMDGNRILAFNTLTLTYRELTQLAPPKLPVFSLIANNKLLLYGGTTKLTGGELSPNMQVVDLSRL